MQRPMSNEQQEASFTSLASQVIDGTNENGVAVATGMLIGKPKSLLTDALQALVVPDGTRVDIIDHRADPPVRIKSTATFYDAGSFVRYVNDFKDHATRVFGDEANGAVRAILDYHKATADARWGSHVAILQLRQTEPWKRWIGNNGKRMDQVTFATFLEDNLVDIASPAGGELLGIAREFEVRRNVSFSSGVRLNNGQHQLTYQEDLTETAKKGTVQVPETFVLGIGPWVGVEPYRIDARLRYRLQDGKLTLWYDLARLEDIVRQAFEDVRTFLGAQIRLDVLLGGVVMLEGK
jgi:uncharacterized protein YfdQ (DUF2303 family)